MQHSGFFSTEAALLTQLLQNYNTQVCNNKYNYNCLKKNLMKPSLVFIKTNIKND